MKKSKIAKILVFSTVLATGFVACTSTDINRIAKQITSTVSTPSLSLKNIAIKSLDAEGITFDCAYNITNPYNVAVTLASVAADVSCNGSKLTTVNSNGGVSLAARSTKTNNLNFKLPYTSLLNLAKNYKNASGNIPCTVQGSVGLDLSKVPALANKNLTLPFTKSFEAPVVKPSLSLSSPKLVLPTVTEMVSAFIKSGMSATKAATAAASLAAGKSVDPSIFDNVDLNMKLNFDLAVKNEGSSPWSYAIKNCSIKTGDSSLVKLNTASAKEITSSSGSIPLTAELNTITAGKFIAQIINKNGTSPVFNLQSGLSFPGTSFSPNLPLDYSKTLSLSSFGLAKN